MKKHLFYLACIFIFSNKINAQAFVKLAGGSGGDIANCIAQTTDGGFVLAGDTYSFGLSKSDILITKFDGSGNLLWNRRYGTSNYDHAYCITATTDGGCAVSGVTGGNSNSLVVIKLDGAGNLEWSKLYNASTRNGAHSIRQTPEGGFVIGGYAETYDNGSWGYVLKTDVSGNLEWSKLIFDRGYYPGIESLVVTQDSGYAFVANESVDNAYYDIFLIKLDQKGNFKWAKSVGGSSTDVPTALIETSEGGFAVTGYTLDSVANQFMYVLRTDKNGNFIFSKRIKGSNGDVAKSIVETAGGNIIIGGGLRSPSGNFTNPFGCKINPLGAIIWTRTVPSDTISFQATQVINTNTNGLAACGYAGKSGAEDFLVSRFDSNFKLCQIASLKRSTENFGTLVDRTVKVSNANTSVSSSGIALITDNLNYASFCTVLPVNLISFTAIPDKNNTALLQWKTAEEINAGSIEIYRSNDGRTFSKLAQLAAKNSANGADYEYVDNSPSAGKNFYKLKFVDKDGEYFFSDIKSVDILKAAIQLFPNPAKDILTLQMNSVPGSIRVQIYTTVGKLVIDEIVVTQNNSITKTFNISRLAAGTYNIRVTSGDTKTSTTFCKTITINQGFAALQLNFSIL